MGRCRTPDQMGQPWTIRPAGTGDLDALVRLEEHAFATDRLSRRALRRLLRSPAAVVLVAETRDGVVGDAILLRRRGSSSARVYSLAVDAAARGRGIARALLERLIETARAGGAARLRLEVRNDNPAARALYASLGFRPIASLPGYYQDGAEGIRLEAVLPDPVRP